MPTGHLSVPELDLHTTGDNLVPVEIENYYARQVAAAGDSGLLRQAFVDSFGHCNFSPAELIAGILAISHRVTTGHWDQAPDPSSLNQVAASLGLGAAQFAEDYYPGDPAPPAPQALAPIPDRRSRLCGNARSVSTEERERVLRARQGCAISLPATLMPG